MCRLTFKKTEIKMILILIFFSSSVIFGQTQDPLDDGPEPPPVPIDCFVNIMLLIGVVFSFLFLYRLNKSNQKNK